VKLRLVFVLIFLALPRLLFAEGWKVVVLVHPLERENIEIEESSFIESLLYTYLSTMTDIEVLLEENALVGQSGPGGGANIDYELFGSLNNDGSNTVITFNVKNAVTAEIVSYTSSHKNSSEMVLKLRSIVQTLFHEPAASATTNVPIPADDITLNGIVGLWRADNGIEMVNFQRDGSTIAFFSSGERMNMRFTIEDNMLKVIQNSPNRERYYQGLPYNMVRELTQKAQPLYFELQLFDQGMTLRGKRIETTAEQSPTGTILLTHNAERVTEWKRHTR
jgi:hypothetical protein